MSEREITRRGILLVLSSPSGAGKTTITRELVQRDPLLDVSVSVTTRARRSSEIDGKHYHFITRPRFDAMVARGELLEHASVFGHFYGTPRAPVEAALASGRDIVSDIDWQGTQQLKQSIRADLVSVFVLPPSMAALEQRLKTRAQDSDDVVQARMAKSADEMSHWPEYDYVFINHDIEQSVEQVQAILTAERVRRERLLGLAEFVNRLRGENQAPWHDLLLTAIREKRLVRFVFHGKQRLAEPHDYGAQKGIDRLFAYQLAGAGNAAHGWRLFGVGEISALELLADTFPGSRPSPSGKHQQWERIYASVGDSAAA
jgi:guanylate kinase